MRGYVGDRNRGRRLTREVYLYHVVDNEETWRRDGAQAVVWQTALNPAIALELLANGVVGHGVLGPEAFPPGPFLDSCTSTDRRGVSRNARPELAAISGRRIEPPMT